MSKLFELLVLRIIRPSVNDTLVEEQHGFRPDRSATTCNQVFKNYVFNAFTNGNQMNVIYTNFRKAFDKVNRITMIKMLVSSGFGEPLLSWVNSYLTNCIQYIKVFGIMYEVLFRVSNIPSGVSRGDTFPQSSSLFS